MRSNLNQRILGVVCIWLFGVAGVLAQPRGPVYSNVRYEDDYSFLSNGGDRGSDPFNRLKKIPAGGKVELTFGGQYRFRFENDSNRRFGASDPPAQSFFLQRLFLFADARLSSRVRVFTEFKYLGITGNELPAALTAHDKPDIQNLFAELWFLDQPQSRFGLRAGRQEMLFGKQRLISTSDWSNTRRTFDGIRLMTNLSGWKVDGFFVQPLDLNPEKLNKADKSRRFAGVYLQSPGKGKIFSAYYLRLDENDPLVKSGNNVPGGYAYNTLGLAFDGAAKDFDWSMEAAYQFGSFSTDDISAYLLSFESGYTCNKIPARPRLALGFDLASGDTDPIDAEKQTFNPHFTVGHPHFGRADQVGPQNLKSFDWLLTAKPHQRVVVKLLGYHSLLAEKRDALYNTGGVAMRRDVTGLAGDQAGKEIDAEVALNLGVHVSTVVGYARFMPGEFIRKTGPAKTHSLFYVMAPLKF